LQRRIIHEHKPMAAAPDRFLRHATPRRADAISATGPHRNKNIISHR